jgi:hypothetical protein
MHHGYRSTATLLLIAVLAVGAAACSAGASDAEETTGDAVQLEPVQGSDVSKVILSPQAVQRLGIRTDQIRDVRLAGRRLAGGAAAGPVTTRKVVPYPAVLYDENGDTWAFTIPEPLTFVRQRIDVDYITGGMAVLLDGPPAGTRVVTVGAIELLGAELGVGE